MGMSPKKKPSNSNNPFSNSKQLYNSTTFLSSTTIYKMHFFTTTAVSALAALSLVQFCPAPPAVIGAVAGGLGGGAISGGIAAGTQNSRRDLPSGVSQESIDQCTQQINDQGTPVNVYSTGDDCKSSPTSMHSVTDHSSCPRRRCPPCLHEPRCCPPRQPCPGRWPCPYSHGQRQP